MIDVIPLRVRRQHKSKAAHSREQQVQITIPVAIRKKYNIQPHDTLLMVANEKHIRLYTKDEYGKMFKED